MDEMNSTSKTRGTHAEAVTSKPRRKLTRRGEIVLKAILSSQAPLTPPEIHAGIWDRDAIKRISLVTVYRIVNILVEEGSIRRVLLPNGESVYESSLNTGQRGYFLCRNCHGIFGLESGSGPLSSTMSVPGGFEVDFQEILLFGHCGKCLGSGKKIR